MTVRELYARMDSREFTEWVVFDKVEREDEEKRQKEWEAKHSHGR